MTPHSKPAMPSDTPSTVQDSTSVSVAESDGDIAAQTAIPLLSPPRGSAGNAVTVRGKFLFAGEKKFHIRGVTYGTFRPDADNHQFPSRAVVEQDFALMVENGLNAVRVYTVPPRWLLDAAWEAGLRVMVGLPWEQHVTFLEEPSRADSIEKRVREGVRTCAGHPAVLCFAVGNEIPASIVRWHERKQVAAFLERLCEAVKEEAPESLVTYVNFPSTEYLQLPFVDFHCFNVYLEKKEDLEAYLARLQNQAGNKPLVMAEIGLDSRRNGLDQQAKTLEWQIRTTSQAGCAGAFVFAWTDEWYRGGHDIEDWDFGLVTRDRQPKPALAAVRRAFVEALFPATGDWPHVSVVVCTYNGARTLRECLEGLQALDYPHYEVIVVDDGSRDESPSIAREFGVRLISTENRGLSAARNTGMEAATGEIVAYLDDDAYPDPHWLQYLAGTFERTSHAAVGGPNIAPPGDGSIAECVVNAPGGPVHVLLSDSVAEHIPGCNMAFRKSCLKEIGGFDVQFHAAGDDVDLVWRMQKQGWTIGFHPAAMVWHHRRNSVRAYWRQQRGYGKAEALLERKWPEKYNTIGHVKWAGQLYGYGLTRMLFRRQHVYFGPWGRAPFQTLSETSPSFWTVLPVMPEWYVVLLALAGVCAMTVLWPKLVLALPLLAFAAGATVWQAARSAAEASFPSAPRSQWVRARRYSLTTFLHLIQPIARLWGRVRHGLTAFRLRVPWALLPPFPKYSTIWSETWRPGEQVLEALVRRLRRGRAVLVLGGEYERWDLEVRGGMLGAARLLMAVEEHGAGKQLFRFRCTPRISIEGMVAIMVFTDLALAAALDRYYFAFDIFAVVALLLLVRTLLECAGAMEALHRALEREGKDSQ